MNKAPFTCKKVKAVFDGYPKKHRRVMLTLRNLIFDISESIEGVGPLEETLKWGEPSYLTSKSKSGSTIRIDWKESNPNQYSMFFHCQTDLVSRFRKQFPDTFEFGGNRSISFKIDEEIPVDSLAVCISAALTYHRDKKRKSK